MIKYQIELSYLLYTASLQHLNCLGSSPSEMWLSHSHWQQEECRWFFQMRQSQQLLLCHSPRQLMDLKMYLKKKTIKKWYFVIVFAITSTNMYVLVVPLTRIINSSISIGEFPSMWKEALVTPILKKGDPTKKENYRPVSCLSVVSKVLEKIVCD